MWICAPEFTGEKIETLHKENALTQKPCEHPAELQNFHWFVRKCFPWTEQSCRLKIAADDACLFIATAVLSAGVRRRHIRFDILT